MSVRDSKTVRDNQNKNRKRGMRESEKEKKKKKQKRENRKLDGKRKREIMGTKQEH